MGTLRPSLIAVLILVGVFLASAESSVRALPPAGSDRLPVVATVDALSRIGTETIALTGWAQVDREAPHDEGGVDVVDMEVVSLELQGVSLIGLITVKERPNDGSDYVSSGEIRSLQPGQDFPASSFFDVYADVTVPASPVGTLEVHNEVPLRLTPRQSGQPVDLSAWPPLSVTYQMDPVFGVDNDGDTLVDEDSADEDGDGLVDEDPMDDDGDGFYDEDGADDDEDGLVDEDPVDLLDNDGDTAVDEDPTRLQCYNTEIRPRCDNDSDGQFDEDPSPFDCTLLSSCDQDTDAGSGSDYAHIDEDPPASACNPQSFCDDDSDGFVDEDLSCIPLLTAQGSHMKAGLCIRGLTLEFPPELPSYSVARGGPSGLHAADILALAPGEAPTPPAPVPVSGNDNFVNSWNVASLPFTGVQNTTTFTTEPVQCGNDTDDDGDTFVNDGCPQVGAAAESSAQCLNAVDDDADTFVNDGCPASGAAETGEPVGLPLVCSLVSRTAWYSYTPSHNTTLTVNTEGSSYDTVLTAFTGSAVNALTYVTCNDDYFGLGYQSQVTFSATAGVTYRFQVAAYSSVGVGGDLVLNVFSGSQSATQQAPFVRIPCLNLGLSGDGCDDGTDGDQDDLDALSYGSDLPEEGSPLISFSVGPGAQGAPSSAVEVQRNCPPALPGTSPEPEPDEFGSYLNSSNFLVLDGNGPIGSCQSAFPLGLYEGHSDRDDLDAVHGADPEEVDGDRNGVPEAPVYFSLDAESPSLVALSPSDVLKTVDGDPPTVYASEAALGLQAGDDLDALCLRESGDGTYDAGSDVLYFSLAPGSPTLTLISAGPGDLLAAGSPPGIVQPAASLGLLAGDDMDAVKCQALKSADGDTDGDTIPNSEDPDDDNDGCLDVQEWGPNQYSGGLRNPHNFWDFYDVPVGASPARDGDVTGLDIFAVIARFGQTGDPGIDPLSPPPPSGYHTAYDRGPVTGPYAWSLGPANGAIAGTDIFAIIAQFGHSCW